jgi:hypothetical protein
MSARLMPEAGHGQSERIHPGDGLAANARPASEGGIVAASYDGE